MVPFLSNRFFCASVKEQSEGSGKQHWMGNNGMDTTENMQQINMNRIIDYFFFFSFETFAFFSCIRDWP